VRDVERSVAFYQRFGFTAEVQWPTYARLIADGGAVLHLAALGEPPPDRPTVSLAWIGDATELIRSPGYGLAGCAWLPVLLSWSP
jgi:catechol 2,3-dioxygenase-like lactoylglutathione lyase family enzyme